MICGIIVILGSIVSKMLRLPHYVAPIEATLSLNTDKRVDKESRHWGKLERLTNKSEVETIE